ncbi:MAG: integration host factor subunit beta [Ignavibacteria bacterium]|nr:integration host factor subunit beta [Ignavibacteria bacterium]
MTKAQIISKISESTGISKKETEIVVEGFISVIIDCMKRNDSIEIRGFGTFKNKIRNPRMARNPKTGEVIKLKKRFIPFFKISKEFKKLVLDSLS